MKPKEHKNMTAGEFLLVCKIRNIMERANDISPYAKAMQNAKIMHEVERILHPPWEEMEYD